MAEYTSKPQILIKKGMNVSLPGDRLPQEWFQFIQNVRSYILGEWRQRPGMELVVSTLGSEDIYSINRINNNLDGTFRRLIGTINGNIYVDDVTHSNLTLKDSGYSGKQYSSIISRPDRSPLPFMFIGSDSRNGKFSTIGDRTEWGLSAPLASISDIRFLGNNYLIISRVNSFTNTIVGSSTYSVSAGAVDITSDRINATNVVLDNAFFDNGSPPGMAIVTLTSQIFPPWTDDLQIGMLIDIVDEVPVNVFSYVETTIVEDIFFPIATTTITGVAYDNGISGLCTITLAAPTEGLRRDSIVNLGGLILGRVLSVTTDQNGVPSFRVDTVAGLTVGMTVSGRYAFKARLSNVPIPPNIPITETNVTAGQIGWSGIPIGLSTATATPTSNNLAIAIITQDGFLGSRPIQADDLFHISLTANYQQVSEIQIQFDVGDGTFTENYYFLAIRAPDLFGAYVQSQLAINAQQTQVTRDQLDQFVQQQLDEARETLPQQDYEALGDIARQFLDSVNIDASTGLVVGSGAGTVSVTKTTGIGQWTEVFVPVGQFQRVGTGIFDWTNVVAIRVTVNATAATGIAFSDMYIRGTYGLNSRNILPYTYVYRARNSRTGSRSNPSPPTRFTTHSERALIRLEIPTYTDTQADVIDIFRIGGLLQDYHLVGTVPSGTQFFFDELPDSIALRNPILEVDRFKPWAIPDLPKSGTCSVVGTSVLRSTGDQFDIRWVRGTQILINGRVYSFYSNPTSIDRVELNESAGSQTNVRWEIPEPLLDGIALPAVFGPFSGAGGEFHFAVGDPRNPGYLYWTNGNDPESSSDTNLLELCSPSERLVHGCVLDGIVYCFSNRRSWRILPSFTGGQSGGGSDFYPQETAMGKGLSSRWGLAVGDAMYFLSFDGVYRSRGDAIESLTDDSLAPVFRRDGTIVSTLAVPVSPVDFTKEDENSLVYSFDGLYLHYMGVDGNRYTFYRSFLTGGWVLDSITGDQMIRSSREILSPNADNVLVGTENGRLLLRSSSSFTDSGTPISCRLWDREEIWDSLRATKQIGDVMIDTNPAGSTITPTLRYDTNESSEILTTISGSIRDQFIKDISSGNGKTVRGVALDLSWSNGTSGIPKAYAWEPSALIKAEETINRASDWTGGLGSGEYTGAKWLQGFRLKGDTSGLTKSFQVEIDGGTFVESFTFTANGEQTQAFSLTAPVVCHEMRIKGVDEDGWRQMGLEWIYEPEPEQAFTWETQVTSFDLPFYSHIREVMIAHRSTSDVTMIVTTDNISNSYDIPHGNGIRIRSYLPVKALKAKYHKFRFTSSQQFGLWIRDLTVNVGGWGKTGAYQILKPFGDISRENGGARI